MILLPHLVDIGWTGRELVRRAFYKNVSSGFVRRPLRNMFRTVRDACHADAMVLNQFSSGFSLIEQGHEAIRATIRYSGRVLPAKWKISCSTRQDARTTNAYIRYVPSMA
jgi:hypothetical protein